MKNLSKKTRTLDGLFHHKNKLMNGKKMKTDWKKETNKVIAKNLVDSISSLLNANVIRQTVVNSRGETKQRIIIEHD